MFRRAILILMFSSIPFFLGTTYIVKDGDFLIGKWVEEDGSNEVKVLTKMLPPEEETRETEESKAKDGEEILRAR